MQYSDLQTVINSFLMACPHGQTLSVEHPLSPINNRKWEGVEWSATASTKGFSWTLPVYIVSEPWTLSGRTKAWKYDTARHTRNEVTCLPDELRQLVD